MKKIRWLVVWILGGVLFFKMPCYAVNSDEYYQEYYDMAQMDEISNEVLDISRTYGSSSSLSFREMYGLLLNGRINEAVDMALQACYEGITGEVLQNRVLLERLMVLVIIAAIFNNYSSVIKFSYVGEQGFYITYLMISVILIQSFTLVYELAEDTVYFIKDIMECMLPAFYMSVVLSSGLGSSQMVNSMFVGMLALLERLLFGIILPAVRIYFFIVLLNQINLTDRFSKLAGLIRQGISLILKAVVTGIVGMNLMKSILVPVYDNVTYITLQKGLSMIPGVGSFSGLGNILVGAGVLIKNSVGIAVVIVLLTFGSVPLLKIFCFYVAYRILLALVQPVSDHRILSGLQGAADSVELLLRAVSTSLVLSVLSVAIILMTTNVRLYAG